MAKNKSFYCERCMVEFEVEVEPGKTENEVESQFPSALQFLDKVELCPVCGDPVEVME